MRKRHLLSRARLLWALRSFFHREGFIELEPPCLVISPGLEPQLDAMQVNAPWAHQASDEAYARRWLHTSPEYAIKRYLGSEGVGVSRVYALSSCFRDELPSTTHSPEFTMLEWYARDLDLDGLMSQCEALVGELVTAYDELAQDDPQLSRAHLSSFKSPFERLSVRDAFTRYAGIDLEQCLTVSRLRSAAARAGVRSSALEGTWDELYFQVFMDLIEPHLGRERPTLLYEFPASQAALARLYPDDPRWAKRFELFIGGVELANAFDELSDPVEQRARFEDDLIVREARGAQRPPIDEALLEALPQLGHCVGIALGFDRLVMLLCGATSIDEVRLQSWSAL